MIGVLIHNISSITHLFLLNHCCYFAQFSDKLIHRNCTLANLHT